MAGLAGPAGSPRNSSVRSKKEKLQQEPWPEEIWLNRITMARAYLLKVVTGIGYLALTWSTVVLLGGFVTALGKKDFWCLTIISMMQAAGIFNDWEDGLMLSFLMEYLRPIVSDFLSYLRRRTILRKKICAYICGICLLLLLLFYPIGYVLLYVVSLVLGIICFGMYQFGPLIGAGISLWRVIQHDYGNMDGDNTKANLMPALDIFYYLILCQGAIFFLWAASHLVVRSFAHSLRQVCEFPRMWGHASVSKYLADTRSKCWRDPKSIRDRRLVRYAVDLLDSQSSQDYLSGLRMLDVFIKHEVDVRPLIIPSSQKIQKFMDTLRWSSSDREIKALAARILAHLACDIDLSQFPGAMRCISSLLGTTLPYWNNQQRFNHQSPQGKWGQLFTKIQKSKLGQLYAKMQKSKLGQLHAKRTKTNLDQQGEGDSQRDCWNELILQGLTILERLASDQHNCRDICCTPDLITKIMSPMYSDTLIQDINITEWQDVVNAAFRVVHRLICAPDAEWTGRRLSCEISCSKQAVSNLERILDQGNTASKELQMRAMEILTELALDPFANLATETIENLINKQLQVFLNEGIGEDLKVTAGKTLALLSKTKLISKTGNTSVCMISQYSYIVDQVTGILDAKNKIIYRKIAAELLENFCTLHAMDKEHVKNTLLPKVLTEVLTSKRKPPSEDVPWLTTLLTLWYALLGDNPQQHDEENPQQDDVENQLQEHNGQTSSSKKNDTQGEAMMELKEALLSLTSVIFDKFITSADDFDHVARKVALGEGEFVANLKNIVEENCEATANSLRIVKLCGQIAITMMRRSQYNTHFKDHKFTEILSKASSVMCNLESCMLFAGTDGGAKKTARPLLSDLVKEAEALVA